MTVLLDTAFSEIATHEAVKGFADQFIKKAGNWHVVDQQVKNAQTGAGVLVVAYVDPYTGKQRKPCVVHYECPESPRLLEDRLRDATR